MRRDGAAGRIRDAGTLRSWSGLGFAAVKFRGRQQGMYLLARVVVASGKIPPSKVTVSELLDAARTPTRTSARASLGSAAGASAGSFWLVSVRAGPDGGVGGGRGARRRGVCRCRRCCCVPVRLVARQPGPVGVAHGSGRRVGRVAVTDDRVR